MNNPLKFLAFTGIVTGGITATVTVPNYITQEQISKREVTVQELKTKQEELRLKQEEVKFK